MAGTMAGTFSERLTGILNGGALTLMISVGHRTGLFEAMRGRSPATSREISDRAGLSERYVREWLGAMVTGGVVDYDGSAGRYDLPADRAELLTGLGTNLAIPAQYIPLLAAFEDQIVRCFRRGGGVPYGSYARLHEVMAEDTGQTLVATLETTILPLVPDLLGKLQAGIDVLDVGCGRGRATNRMARLFPRSRFSGYDISDAAIASARMEANRGGTRNLRFEVRDCAGIPDREAFDLVTAFDVLRDQSRPDAILAGARDALRAGGTLLMQDIRCSSHLHNNLGHPLAPLIYTISCMHCMSVSLAAGGAGLGAALGEEKALEMLLAAGFRVEAVHHLPHDVLNTYYVARRST
ncbi:MAG TPA: methyltransferase domain-containing protein [Planctomycetota bacterium]|nr:methyltransferase domain-containing protein [Planctomycetota bacterium]